MNFVYQKVIEFFLGQAMANSDRIKAAVISTVAIVLLQLAGACQICSAILTPAVVQAISLAIGTMAVAVIAALTHRDIAAPGEFVPGAAIPVSPTTVVPPIPSAKIPALILGLLLLGSMARADVVAPKAGWCAGPALWAGSALYQTNGSSALVPTQSALGGVEFGAYLGSWTGNDFAPDYTLGLFGAMDTAGAVNSPAIGLTGGFYFNGVPLTIFAAKELTANAGGLLWGVGTNVQFSGWVPFLYLGHPGN